MGFLSSLGSFISSAVSTVSSVVSSAVTAVKDVAVKTVNWLADKAETFVGNIQNIWKAVKPYISAARVALTALAAMAPWPIVKTLALGLERTLAFIENIDSHPLMEKLKKAIDWVIKWAKDIKEKILTDIEIEEAEARAKVFDETVNEVPPQEQVAVKVAALINSYMLVKAKTLKAVNSGHFQDFNHYLRIRAAQKLLDFYEKRMTSIEKLSDVDADMASLMDISTSLLASRPSLTLEQTQILNELTTVHFGKPVIPFVFEEMILAWNIELQELENQWTKLNQSLSRDKVLYRRLSLASRDEKLTAEEQVMLNDLETSVARDIIKLETLETTIREKRNYVFASEGFLQLLEKDEQALINDGQDYLAERGEEVGELIIRCAQKGTRWVDLNEEEQSLIIDFANIFEEDCRARTKGFTEVEVGL